MIDNNNIYLFHNVYGDADELISSAPENVVAVPFGWTDEIEANRNNLFNEMNYYASCLPSVAFWMNEVIEEEHEQDGMWVPTLNIPAHWKEIRVEDMPKPWNWGAILDEISRQKGL
jgi:hypothetical protein